MPVRGVRLAPFHPLAGPGALEAEYGSPWGEPYPEVLDVVTDLEAATPAVRSEWVARAERLSQICEGLPIDQIAVAP